MFQTKISYQQDTFLLGFYLTHQNIENTQEIYQKKKLKKLIFFIKDLLPQEFQFNHLKLMSEQL